MISSALAILETDEERGLLSVFYETNKDRFYSIAFEHLHNAQDSEDAVQETFLRIARKPEKFFTLSDEARIYHVCAIVRNVSVDMYKKKTKYKLENISDNTVYSPDTEPLENSLLEKISHEELLAFINALPELQRNVLMLTCLSGLSISETAETLNISRTAVNQRLYLARRSIRKFVERKCHE